MATTDCSWSTAHGLCCRGLGIRLAFLVVAEAGLEFLKNHLYQLKEKLAIKITKHSSAVVFKCRPLVGSRDVPLCDMAICVASR